MKIVFLAVFFIISYPLTAQMSFYLRPKATMKTNYGSDFNRRNQLPDPKIVGYNKYFMFYNNGLHFNNNELNLGINVGLKISQKQSFEIGFATDNSSIESSVISDGFYKGEDNSQNYISNSDYLLYGRSFARFSLESHTKIAQLRRLDTRVQMGVGIFYNRWVNRKTGEYAEETLPLSGGENVSGENISLSGMARNISPYRLSPIIQMGLGFDFKTKKGKYLFSFDTFYTQNLLRNMQVVLYNYTIIDNGSVSNYEYTLRSKGSGFYFQLSRTFQVYPWKKKVKKVEL